MSTDQHIADLRAYGIAQFAMGHCESAAASLLVVCTRHPEDALAHKVLGVAQAQLGQHSEAYASLKRALVLKPNDIECECILGDLAMRMVRYKNAFAHLQTCLSLDPDATHPHGVRARMLIRRLQRLVEAAVK
jgi:tetratricopeptide (TPR) repeat protein